MYVETLIQLPHQEPIGGLEKWTGDLVLEPRARTNLARLRRQRKGA